MVAPEDRTAERPPERMSVILCLFSGEALRQSSCLRDNARWLDRTEQGTCEYVSHTLGAGPTPQGSFSGLVAVVALADLESAPHDKLVALCARFIDHRAPVDLVAADSPVGLFLWIGERAPFLSSFYHQDGDVKLASPAWWRRRAERYLSEPLPEQPDPKRSSTSTVFTPAVVRQAKQQGQHAPGQHASGPGQPPRRG